MSHAPGDSGCGAAKNNRVILYINGRKINKNFFSSDYHIANYHTSIIILLITTLRIQHCNTLLITTTLQFFLLIFFFKITSLLIRIETNFYWLIYFEHKFQIWNKENLKQRKLKKMLIYFKYIDTFIVFQKIKIGGKIISNKFISTKYFSFLN